MMRRRLLKYVIFSVLLVDLAIVGSCKLLMRRQRPAHNKKDMIQVIRLVDKYSFPSGHTTRAVSMALFITTYFPMSSILQYCIYSWCVVLAASRVMLGRHHVLDVGCGCIIGVLQYVLTVHYCWIPKDTCEWLIRPIQEELHI